MRRRCATPRIGRAARWLRGIRPDRNPLRRATDRVEVAILALLVIAFAALTPVAVSMAGRLAGSGRPAAASRSAPHQVTAVLLNGAPGVPPRISATAPYLRARARWTAPDGAVRTGAVPVPPGARAGSTVRIWVDASGRLAATPQQPADRRQVELAAVLVTGTLLLSAARLTRWLADRRRMAAWDAEWRITGPRWSTRR